MKSESRREGHGFPQIGRREKARMIGDLTLPYPLIWRRANPSLVVCFKFSKLTHTTFSGFRARQTAEAVAILALPPTPRQSRVLVKGLQRLRIPIAWLI